MLGELNGIRNACVTNLEMAGLKDFSVPDIVNLVCRHALAFRNTPPP
jgi:hypothetical protein